MDPKKVIKTVAEERVEMYEKSQGRRVQKSTNPAYDFKATLDGEFRFIEVKGVSESWESYTFQSITVNEYNFFSRKYRKILFVYCVF